MRTSTFPSSTPSNPQINLATSLFQFNDSSPQLPPSSVLQQTKFLNDSAAPTSTNAPSTPDFLNQFNLLLLSNQLMSFSNDFNSQQASNIIGNGFSFSNEKGSGSSQDQRNFVSEESQDNNDYQQQQRQVEDYIQPQRMRNIRQNQDRMQRIENNQESQMEQNEDITTTPQEKTRTFSFNQNTCQEQENTQITRQQLLLGLMGLEQQLKKLQEQSQQKHQNACNGSSSSQSNSHDEDDSPQQVQQPQFVSFCNIPNENTNDSASATPVYKRSARVDLMNNLSLSKQGSSISTQIGGFSNDVLTPSTKMNVMSTNYKGNIFGGSEGKNTSENIHPLSLELNQSMQYSEINEFCLDDDDENPRIETSTMSESKSRDFNKIKEVIYFIVNNLDKDEENLACKRRVIQEDEHFSDKKAAYLIIFDRLIKKFKHLKKTKEEKTKFCMRKAFRYLFAHLKTICNSKMNLKEANEICMKHYFSQHVNDSQFVLPFRRNSSIKTMNAAFLKKVFSSTKFVQDYRDFLHFFDRLSLDDNSKKVDQLAYYILPMVEENKFEKIEGLRRLPWTMSLLDSTRSLAYQLLEFEDNHIPLNQIIPNSQQTIPNYSSNGNESLRDSVSIFNSPLLCANNLQSLCQSNDENLSNVDTLSIQTRNRMISDPLINIDLISRKLSISSNDSQNHGINSQDYDHKQVGESQNITDSHLSCLQQINSALVEFQSCWNQHQQLIQKQKSKLIKREVIILTPPLYDLNENPHKKLKLNFCK